LQNFQVILICARLGRSFVANGREWIVAAVGALFGSLISDLSSIRIFIRAWPITRETKLGSPRQDCQRRLDSSPVARTWAGAGAINFQVTFRS